MIDRIKQQVKTDASVVKGIGDDCAVLKFTKSKYLLFTCDMLVEGVDFLRQDNPVLVGRKALAVSISDIAACCGVPRYALVALGLRRNSSVELVDKILKGMRDLAKAFKINLVGGDLSRAQKLVINISLLGEVEKKYLVLRSGAKKGDIIFVSGALGGSLSGKHLTFMPRLKQARFLAKNFKPSAMIDISDGLIQDLSHILKESKAGAAIYEELIPLSKQARNLSAALSDGEDFELLFTLSPSEARKLMRQKREKFIPIGEITGKKSGLRLIDKYNRERLLKLSGFRHF